MSHDSAENLWNLAFSNVGREDEGERRTSDEVARAIYTVCGIGQAWCSPEGVTGENDTQETTQPEGVAVNGTPLKPAHDNHAQSSAQHGGVAADETTPTPAHDHHTQSSAHGNIATNDTATTPGNDARSSRAIPGRPPRTYPGTLPTWRVDEQH